MKTTLACILLAFAMVLSAAAADVTGKWTGTISIETNDPQDAFLVLKQDGSTITGTAGPNEGEQWPIKSGKIEGNKVVLEVVNEEHWSYKLELVLDGDKLAGDVTMTRDDQTMKAKLSVARVK